MEKALDWCQSVLGPIEVMSDHSKIHGGHESSTCRLQTPVGFCYLKIHESEAHWHNEVHAYERWANAFGSFAPNLLAARDERPLAIAVAELPGQVLENIQLSPSHERSVWRTAGAALIALHELETGTCFGPCLRDGSFVKERTQNAVEYISKKFKSQINQGIQGGYINDDELAVLQAAYDLIPAFNGERPCPCHRDYCAANLLVSRDGTWAGVIDFEFAYWDVRVADFSRDPDWAWNPASRFGRGFF